MGTQLEIDYLSRTGLLPTMARLSKTLPLGISFVTRVRGLVPPPSGPATPNWQRHQAIAPVRFRLIPFRSPLLRESQLFSSPRVTEMFQFTRFPPLSPAVSCRSKRGCPIRRWWAQCLLAAPPPLSQRSHVLLRHAAPRHPPFARSVFPDEKLELEHDALDV